MTTFLLYQGDGMPCLSRPSWQDESRMVDIALLPPYRNAGIGTAILRDLLAAAASAH
jgi:hypothetical protein